MRGIFGLLVGWFAVLKLDWSKLSVPLSTNLRMRPTCEGPRVAGAFHRSYVLPADTAPQPFSVAELRHLYGALVASCSMFTNVRSVLSIAGSCAELAGHVSSAQVLVGTLGRAMVLGLQRY